MKDQNDHKKSPEDKENEEKFPGYPVYAPEDDIYNHDTKLRKMNPGEENVPELGRAGKNNEKDFSEDESGDDLDVPGADLDDDMEEIGSEDEENNYYSLGGDDHDDLDEDRGE